MVKQKIPEESKPELIYLPFNSIDSIKSSKYQKMLLKFSTTRCPPCHNMKKWLETEFKPEGVVPIFNLVLDDQDLTEDQEKALTTLQTIFNIVSVPTLVVVDRTLDAKNSDSVSGFSPEGTAKFINKHFKN